LIDPQKLTAVIFDLDGTLRHSIPSGDEVFLDFAASLGAPITPEIRNKARRWAYDYWADSECLLIDVKAYGKVGGEFWENYAWRQLQSMGISNTQAKVWAPLVHQHMKEHYDPQDVIPEDVIPTLKTLRAADLTVGVVTNRENPVDVYLHAVGLAEHLDFYFAAGDIGAWKPAPEIFYYAMGLANAKPEEAVYIGDNYYADVLGALNANLQPILIDPDGIFPEAVCPVIQAIGELEDMLVLKSPS
jgi:HAD superfamily hydrolase (TIGR01549 family)